MKKIKQLKQNYVVSSDFGFCYKSLRCIEYIKILYVKFCENTNFSRNE